MLYFSYGSNLNRSAMARRCPGAKPVGVARLDGFRLQFRGYAHIALAPGHYVQGAVYEITESHARLLDAYEDDAYERIKVTVTFDGKACTAMAYAMKKAAPAAPPRMDYYREVALGYRDWGLDQRRLRRARYDTLNVGGANAPALNATTAPTALVKKRDIRWDPARNPSGDLEALVRPPLPKKR